MRICILTILAVVCSFAQPKYSEYWAIPIGSTLGSTKYFEQRSNGTNYLQVQGATSMPGNLTWSPDNIGSRQFTGYFNSTYDTGNSWNWQTVSAAGACPNGVVTIAMGMTYTNAGGGNKTPLSMTMRPCTSFGFSPLDSAEFAGSVLPQADNVWTSGSNARRWADVRTVLLNGVTPPTSAASPIDLTSGVISCPTCVSTSAANLFTNTNTFENINTYSVIPRSANSYQSGGNGFEWSEVWSNEFLLRNSGNYVGWMGYFGRPILIVGNNDGAGTATGSGFSASDLGFTLRSDYGIQPVSMNLLWNFVGVGAARSAAILQVADAAGALQNGQNIAVSVRNSAGTGSCTLTFTAGWLTGSTC